MQSGLIKVSILGAKPDIQHVQFVKINFYFHKTETERKEDGETGLLSPLPPPPAPFLKTPPALPHPALSLPAHGLFGHQALMSLQQPLLLTVFLLPIASKEKINPKWPRLQTLELEAALEAANGCTLWLAAAVVPFLFY